MAKQVVNLAMTKCSFGMAPSLLMVLPINMVMCGNQPAANIMDYKPLVNILPFGMCQSMANPTVIAATSAAMGVLTPMPCIPNTIAPWVPGAPTVIIANFPALNDTSKCMCLWAGVIEITNPGQMTTDIP